MSPEQGGGREFMVGRLRVIICLGAVIIPAGLLGLFMLSWLAIDIREAAVTIAGLAVAVYITGPIHEAAHWKVGNACGFGSRALVIWAPGLGVFQPGLESQPAQSRLRIAAAGPAVDAVAVIVYLVAWLVLPGAAGDVMGWACLGVLSMFVVSSTPVPGTDGHRMVEALRELRAL